MPNLGSVVLSRVLARLNDDWQERYGHPVLIVETFVDPERFQGTVYRAAGWTELGRTQGHARKSRDYYENHDRPKRLFARELEKHARRSLQAEHLKPALAAVGGEGAGAQHAQGRRPHRTGRPLSGGARLSSSDRTVSALHLARDHRGGLSGRRAARAKRSGPVCPAALRGATLRVGGAPHRARRVSFPQPADLQPDVRAGRARAN